nr:MAG TPA: hypothetical protein [Caudoviricetes sp.]
MTLTGQPFAPWVPVVPVLTLLFWMPSAVIKEASKPLILHLYDKHRFVR